MAATITHTPVEGAPTNPQSIGHFKVVTVDSRITSGDANDAGDFVVDPADLGLTKIFGVVDLHVYASDGAADDVQFVHFTPATNTVTFLDTDLAALDLDSTDYAQARLQYWGY